MVVDAKPKKSWYKRWWAIVLFVFIGLMIVGSLIPDNKPKDEITTTTLRQELSKVKETTTSTTITKTTTTSLKDVVKVDAVTLYLEYEQNAIRADESYKGKLLEVQGVVNKIDKDLFDKEYILFYSDNIFAGVQCMLKESETSKALSLNPGDEINVQGVVTGKQVVYVVLEKCVIKT